MGRIVGAVTALLTLLMLIPAFVRIAAQDNEQRCAHNLANLCRLLEIYRRDHGGGNYELPVETGEAFWMKLVATGVIDSSTPSNPTDAVVLQCPVEGNRDTVPDYRGPRLNVNVPKNYRARDPTGGDKVFGGRTNHGNADKEGVNVLTKGSQVFQINSMTEADWKNYLEKTTQRNLHLFPGTRLVYEGEAGTLTVEISATETPCAAFSVRTDKEVLREWCTLDESGWRVVRWWVNGKEIVLEPTEEDRKAFEALLDDLNSDDPEARSKAFGDLFESFARARPQIERRLTNCSDPEVSSRLKQLLDTGMRRAGFLKFKFPLKVGEKHSNDYGAVYASAEEKVADTPCIRVETKVQSLEITYWLSSETLEILKIKVGGAAYTRRK